MESFYFWPDPAENLKEVYRVLKEQGTFLLVADIYQKEDLPEQVRENIQRFHLYNPTPEDFRELLENARETAQKYFHCEGVACFHNVDLWRKTSPAAGLANWAFWPFGGAWMCRNLYEEYLFTLDREYLQEIFPVLEEHARFCSNMLQ